MSYSPVRKWFSRMIGGTSKMVTPDVLVTGMPKSGTTAIVKLMGIATGRPAISDPFYRLDVRGVKYRDELFAGSLTIGLLLKRYPEVFRADLIKDPNLLFFYQELKGLYPDASWVFTIRDPRDNIRSVLNRLGLPGHVVKLTNLPARLGDTWRRVLEGKTPRIDGQNPIERLAGRWVRMAEIAAQAGPEMLVSRYEDFITNKEFVISNLCRSAGLDPVNPIAAHKDMQFQPPGDRQAVWSDFFGESELAAIEDICGGMMIRFGYDSDEYRK